MTNQNAFAYSIRHLKQMPMLTKTLSKTISIQVVVTRVPLVTQIVILMVAQQQDRLRMLLLKLNDIEQVSKFLLTWIDIIIMIRIEVITQENINRVLADQLTPRVATMYVANKIV